MSQVQILLYRFPAELLAFTPFRACLRGAMGFKDEGKKLTRYALDPNNKIISGWSLDWFEPFVGPQKGIGEDSEVWVVH